MSQETKEVRAAVLAGTIPLGPLIECGLIPRNSTRVTIDFLPGDVVRLHYELLPDAQQIDTFVRHVAKNGHLLK